VNADRLPTAVRGRPDDDQPATAERAEKGDFHESAGHRHCCVPVTDFARAVEFYRDILGFTDYLGKPELGRAAGAG
jgi:hypothetical protein